MSTNNPNKRVKLSGSQYLKKRTKRHEEDQLLASSMRRFVKPSENNPGNAGEGSSGISLCESQVSESIASGSTDVTHQSSMDMVFEDSPVSIVTNPLSVTVSHQNDGTMIDESDGMSESTGQIHDDSSATACEVVDLSNQDHFQLNSTIYSDPAKWPTKISQPVRDEIVKMGPTEIDPHYKYPKNYTGRSFPPTSMKKKLINGEIVSRSWLVYSVSEDKAFCYCCKLFTDNDSRLVKSGFDDWKNFHNALKSHEHSSQHLNSLKDWKALCSGFKSEKTIDMYQQKILDEEAKRWRNVLQRLIAIVKFLARQNLAFRGTNEKLYLHDNGNFLKLVELLGEFDTVMTDHINRVQSKQSHVHYLGKDIQNDLIEVIASKIRTEILRRLRKAKYYSIILDCTPDISRKEQMSVILRFVDINENGNVEVFEHFLTFVEVNESTGEALTEVIIKILEEYGIDIQDMRGQGYDNGSNMKGKKSGVQKRILVINNRAFFVPCFAHSLNLVVCDAAKSSRHAVGYFQLVQEVYNFLSGSTRRWNVLKSNVQINLTVKPLSQTRWESRIESIRPMRYFLSEIVDVLLNISDDDSFDADVKYKSEMLANQLTKFEFICCTVLWHKILNQINITSKTLQTITIDLSSARHNVEKTLNCLRMYRSNEGFEEMLTEASVIAEKMDVEPNFTVARRGRKRRNADGTEIIVDPKEAFFSECFCTVLDTAIDSIEERFQQLNGPISKFDFLFDIGSIKNNFNNVELTNLCHELKIVLTSPENNADIDDNELCDELTALSHLIEPGTHPEKVLKIILENDNFTPNTSIALRILLTLPVTVASGERSFSKLKLIKNYLRSSSSQERLNGLSTISIEHQLLDQLDYDDLIHDFAAMKARKVAFE